MTKNYVRGNIKKGLSVLMSLLMAFSLVMPAFAAEETQPEVVYGTVEAITKGIAVEGTEEITATNEEDVTLSFSKANPAIGRMQDGWWAGIKVVAPASLTAEELKNAKYRRWNSNGWSDPISFWTAKDSKNDAAVHYMEAWMCVTPEIIANDNDGLLTLNYEFDWYGNGFDGEVQKITYQLDVTKINLDMTPFLGSVEAITEGLSAEGTEEITVTNKEEITLEFAKADPSIGRNKDGWWAGIKLLAPAGLTEEELKTATFRKNTDGQWSDAYYFWSVKDSADTDALHWVGIWAYVSPEELADAVDNKLIYSYEFDWYGNGLESETQKINFVIDTEKVILDHENHYGAVEAFTQGLGVSGTTDITVTNEEDVTLSFSKANPAIGRMQDGWWAGIKVVAPASLTAEELKNAKYRRWNSNGWSDPISFWTAKDSKNDAAVHYMEAWMCVTPEIIANDNDGLLTFKYEFDWDGNGFGISVQKIDFVLDITKINLDMTPFLGSVEAITEGLTAEGTEEITVTNTEEITLEFAKADPSIGRMNDGWWAGFKVIAPAGLTEEEIRNVKFRKNTDGSWSNDGLFWDVKNSADTDTVHWVGVWTYVTPEMIAEAVDGKLTYSYMFDWYGNGFDGEVQKINVVLDTEKLVLDTEYNYGTVKAITNGLAVEGTEDITVTNKEEMTLSFHRANPSIGRMNDGWWAGIKVIAPAELTAEELKASKYLRTDAKGTTERVFWNVKDSADGADVHYIEMWVMVTPALIAGAEDNKLTTTYEFDWDGNGYGISTQKIDFVLDTTKIKLDMSTFLGSVEAITEGLTAEGTEEITVTNTEEITLEFAKADPSIGRMNDGWWAGFKVIAPAGLTEEEIRNVKFRKNTDGSWSNDGLFWDVKNSADTDTVHWVGVWTYVTPEMIAEAVDGKLTYSYMFDWYGNGFDGEVQKINVVLDTEKVILDHEDYYAAAEAITEGLEVTGTTDLEVKNSEEITLDYAPVDPSIGRNKEGWWAGFKVVAPAELTEAQLKDVRFRKSTDGQWSEPGYFWDVKNSAEGDESHWVGVWAFVTPELIASAQDNKIIYEYEFDWDGNGFGISTQKVRVVLDTEKIKLIHSEGCTKVIDIPAKAAECLADGNTEASHCGVCGLILSTYEVIPSYNGHNFTEKIMDEAHLFAKADCVYYDRYYYSCTRCDVMSEDTYEDTEGSQLLPHVRTRKIDELHLVSPADCENAAIYYEGCENCDTVFKDTSFSDGEPKNHLWTIEKVTSKAGIKKTGYISYYCKDCGEGDNDPIPVPAVTLIKLAATSYNYTGKAIAPAVTVKDAEGNTLRKGTDYTVAYSNNIVPGTATVKITFKGYYTGSYSLNFKIVIPATSKIIFTSNNSAVRIQWSKVAGAAGYKIFRKTSTGWKDLGNTSRLYATITKLSPGTRYTFAVKAAVKYNGKLYWSTTYTTINTATTASATAKITTTQTTNAIKLTWSAVKGASGYGVYLKTSTGWKLLGNTTKTTATFKNLKAGTNYIYAVRTITLTASKVKVLGGYRQIVTATKPATPTVNVSVSGGKATIKWSKVAGATGYQVYYRSPSSGSFVLIKTVGSSVTSLSDSGYTAGRNYTFAVRAYKGVTGGNVYGAMGQKTVTMK